MFRQVSLGAMDQQDRPDFKVSHEFVTEVRFSPGGKSDLVSHSQYTDGFPVERYIRWRLRSLPPSSPASRLQATQQSQMVFTVVHLTFVANANHRDGRRRGLRGDLTGRSRLIKLLQPKIHVFRSRAMGPMHSYAGLTWAHLRRTGQAGG